MFFYDCTLISVSIETILSNKDRLFCLPTPGYMWPSVDHYRKWCDRKDICKTDFCRNIDNHNNCRKNRQDRLRHWWNILHYGFAAVYLKGAHKAQCHSATYPTVISYNLSVSLCTETLLLMCCYLVRQYIQV